MKQQLSSLLHRKTPVLFTIIMVIVLMVVGTSTVSAQPAKQTWNLVWSDEFDGSSVNTSNWNFETGGGGWGNNELEYYTNGANASVSGGILTITAKRENVGGMAYTSTRMTTQNKRSWTYGKIESRIALPSGQGLWPAFWMLGTNIGSVGWPLSGEIDVMEHINTIPTINGTIHWDSGGHVSYGGTVNNSSITAYHTYTVEWTSSEIRWYQDGAQYATANILNNINSTEEFHRPFFLLLNLAVGGAWPGNPDGSTPFPSTMRVDYVRVYQQGGAPAPTATSGGGGGGISTTAWYSVHNKNSAKCVDARGSATANGTAVQQYTCNSSFAQQWQFQTTSGGYYRVNNRNNSAQVWDVSNVSMADNALIHLWTYGGGNNQQWLPVSEGGGFWHFVSRNSGKCLDVPAASTADSVQLVQYTCNGTGAQSFSLQAH
jgi:beta-glucanase (GH16 family)